MSVISLYFFIFLFAVLCVYYCIRSAYRWMVLLAASGAFFVLGCGWRLSIFFIVQVLLAYGAALWLDRLETCKNMQGEKQPDYDRLKKRVVTGALVAEISALVLFKESSFFVINFNLLNNLLHFSESNLHFPTWLAPLGMSYYTLMLVSYILDVHWGTSKPQKNPFKLILYAGFFPQMVAGPLTRYGEIKGELYGEHHFNLEQVQFGLQRFVWGLFKKLVISERFAIIAAFIYDGGLEGTWTPTGSYVWIGFFAYMIQVYTDFSGCMDIVIGAAQMFGVKLPENFRQPFYSTSLSEFWRRWHITLGLWARDYIMYPFLKSEMAAKLRNFCKIKWGKNAAKKIPPYLGTLLVWLYIGFWHGGSYKYVFFGIFSFIVIVGGQILEKPLDKLTALLRINTEVWSWQLWGRLRTGFLFMVSASMQRALSLSNGIIMWKNAFDYNPWVFVDGSLYKLGLDALDFWVMIFASFVLMFVSHTQQRGSVRAIVAKQNLVFRWFLYLALFVAVLLFGMYGEGYNPADFIYGGF